MNKLVCIHSHVVFGVDDGAITLEMSKYLIDNASSMKVSKIVCTPHYYYSDLRFDETVFKRNFKILNVYAKKKGITLFIGSENFLTHTLLNDLEKKCAYTINGTKYVLVELKRNNRLELEDIISILDDLKVSGYMPVMAHPEYINIFQNVKNISKLRENGVLMQLDASSIVSKKRALRRLVKKIFKGDLVDLVASDAHNKDRNFDSFYEAYKYVEKKYGVDKAKELFCKNPSRIIKGGNL